MKKYCNMIGNFCGDQFIIPDEFELEECIHPNFLPIYKDHRVPDYVGAGWTLHEDGVWSDSWYVRWPDGVPEGPTPDDPNYTGPWPIVEEEPVDPEEQSEAVEKKAK